MYNNRRTYSGRGGRYQGFSRLKTRNFSKYIDPSLYVNKAQDFDTIEDTATLNSFSGFNLDKCLLKNIENKGYQKPTLIQDQAIGPILKGQDVLGIASTGTGKTAAFAIPLINQICSNFHKRILILAPTRELATQIKDDFRSLSQDLRVYVALAIGGANIRRQIQDIKRSPHIIIGTPGRILDLAKRNVINFSQIDTLVLDEVDRMLDMGFIHDIRAIVKNIPANRQTLFFSATIDSRVETLINSFLTNPLKISLKSQDTSSHVEQDIIRASKNNKEATLCQLLNQPEFKKVLVFGTTKRGVDKLTSSLFQKGFRVDSIHGNKPQNKRQRVINAFKQNQISILVATDVAARGLDIADITHVINFDQPQNYQDYIHRIGRTGRGNSKGFALTFI